jgi:iron complex outermembrane receptor protein
LTYDDGQVFAGLSYAYTGRNYYTYENDNPIAAYDLVDLNMGYRWQAEGPLKDTEISLNVSNLLDKKYISAFTGNVPNDPDGTAQVLLSGSPRTVFVSLRHKF